MRFDLTYPIKDLTTREVPENKFLGHLSLMSPLFRVSTEATLTSSDFDLDFN